MRMALDFMVYLGVVTLFNVVVGQDEDGALSKVEIVFTIYITVRMIFLEVTTVLWAAVCCCAVFRLRVLLILFVHTV